MPNTCFAASALDKAGRGASGRSRDIARVEPDLRPASVPGERDAKPCEYHRRPIEDLGAAVCHVEVRREEQVAGDGQLVAKGPPSETLDVLLSRLKPDP